MNRSARVYFLYYEFLLMPLNFLLHATSCFSFIQTKPTLALFPNHEGLREGAKDFHCEVMAAIAHLEDVRNDRFFKNIVLDTKLWKRLYLKFYGKTYSTEGMSLCPGLCSLLATMPEVHFAMLSILEPGACIAPHNGLLKSCYRYHLTIESPGHAGCFLGMSNCEKYVWTNGSEIMFDDTHNHWAMNCGDKARVVLFLDVERPVRYGWVRTLNRWFIRNVASLPSFVD